MLTITPFPMAYSVNFFSVWYREFALRVVTDRAYLIHREKMPRSIYISPNICRSFGNLARREIFCEGMQAALREATIDENNVVQFIKIRCCLEE